MINSRRLIQQLLALFLVLKVNYLSHQMAITLAEKGFLEKTRKAEQETPIT